MIAGFSLYVKLLHQAQQVTAWNRRIISLLPSVADQADVYDRRSLRYLRGRKRVFTDFAAAAEKVAAALLRSGLLLLFQLETEVNRLTDLTLHEVQELSGFLTRLIRRFPAEQPRYAQLLAALAEIEAEILPYDHRPRFS